MAQQARFLDDRRPGRSPRLPADRTAAVVALAIEAVKCIGAIFEVEREINGMAPQERLRMRNESGWSQSSNWLREQAGVSRNSETGQAIETASSAGVCSLASSTTGASARRTTPPSASYGPSRSVAATARSPALMKAEAGPRFSIRAKLKDIDPQARLADVLARFRHSAPVLPKVPRNTAPARPVNTSAPSNVVVENGSSVLSNETRCQIAWICGLNISHGASTIG